VNYDILIADKNTNGSIRNTANYDRIPSVWVVEQAEQYIYERLRIREMLDTAVGTLTAGAGTVVLPPRYRAARNFQFTGSEAGLCTLRDATSVRELWSYDGNTGARTTGKPLNYSCDATSIVFDYIADKDYPYSFLHWAALAPLTSQNPTNVLTDRCVRTLNLACLGFAAEHMKQPQDRQYYLQLTDAEILLQNQNADMENASMQDEAAYAA